MTSSLTIRRPAHFRVGRRSQKRLLGEPLSPAPADAVPRIPRLSRLMALAIRFDHLIRTGAVADQADLARLGHVTRARVTQVMNLLLLAPDIQEEILFSQVCGDELPERKVRSITGIPDWRKQRSHWRTLKTSCGGKKPLDNPN